MTEGNPRLATATLDSGARPYEQNIRTGHHQLVSDEPTAVGGADAGPTPYGLLVAALASCTSITLRMYADRKGWPLGAVHVACTILREGDVERIERTITLSAALPAEQRDRLAEIAEKTPVTKTLKRGVAIATTVVAS